MNVTELREQAVTFLPRREALGRWNFTFAHVHADNDATALNIHSSCSNAWAGAAQTIIIG